MPPLNHSSRLRFERTERGTALVVSHTELPLVVLRPLRGAQGQAVVVQLTPAGALFDGDVINLSVDCGPGTDVTLTTVAATRLNRCDHGEIVFELDATVGPGATLRILPHELIPFRATRYRQRLRVDLAEDSAAMVLDVVTPGRSAEPFAYARLELETEVRSTGTLAVRERFVLEDGVQAALGGFTHYGGLFALGPDLDQIAADAAAARLMARGAWASASKLPTAGIGMKMLGDSALTVRDTLLEAAQVPNWLRQLLPL